MEKKIRLNIFDRYIDVVVKSATYFHKTSHYSYGQIYVSCPLSTPDRKIVKYIERCYPKKTIAKFSSDYLYSDDYCYVLGEKRRVIRPNKGLTITKDDIYVKDDDELKRKLLKLEKEIILSRVRKYESIMGLKHHDVKITNMYAARGKNYVTKNLLTFSKELIHFSIDLIDAIVIHELAHDFIKNHSSAFYKIVYQFCQDYDIKINKMTYGEKK